MLGIKRRFTKYLTTHFGIFDGPTTVGIRPMGYVCNHACPMCWRFTLDLTDRKQHTLNEKNHLTIEEYEKLFITLPSSVCHIDVIGGGEPLLYPYIHRLCRGIKNKGLSGRIITNGSPMNRSMSEILVESHWDEVRISFHAGSPEVYKKINGVDDFKNVLKNVKELVKLKKQRFPQLRVSLLFVMQKNNAKDAVAFAKLGESLEVDEIEFDQLSVNQKSAYLLMTASQIQQLRKDLQGLCQKLTIKHNIPFVLSMLSTRPAWGHTVKTKDYFKDKYCQYVESNIEIAGDGSIFPCCFAFGEMKALTIRAMPLSEIWKKMRPIRLALLNGKFLPFCYKYCGHNLEKR